MSTATYGLLGYPLGHSFSAKYFAQKFVQEGIDAEYRNFEYPSIREAISALWQMKELRGFNVTIPYKQAIIPYLTTLSPKARAIGAVNVVRVERTSPDVPPTWHGYNSDIIGFRDSLVPLLQPYCETVCPSDEQSPALTTGHKFSLHDRHLSLLPAYRQALVLGTGGASKAVVHALHELGIRPQYISRHKSEDALAYEELTPEIMSQYRIIINCTPLGMYPHTDACPPIPYAFLTPSYLLYDLVYNPIETLFMKRGAEQGATVKNGLDMLHRQAEAAWMMWQE